MSGFLINPYILSAGGGGGGETISTLGTGFHDLGGTPGTSLSISLDMSAHDGSSPVVIALGEFGNAGVGNNFSSMTLDGNAGTERVDLVTAGDGTGVAIYTFPGTSYAASSTLAITMSGSTFAVGASAFMASSATTVTAITSLPESTRTGSTLDGNTTTGRCLIACQLQLNGTAGTWSGLTGRTSIDIRSTDYFDVGYASNITGETPRAVSVTGANVRTSAVLVEVY